MMESLTLIGGLMTISAVGGLAVNASHWALSALKRHF